MKIRIVILLLIILVSPVYSQTASDMRQLGNETTFEEIIKWIKKCTKRGMREVKLCDWPDFEFLDRGVEDYIVKKLKTKGFNIRAVGEVKVTWGTDVNGYAYPLLHGKRVVLVSW